MTINVEIVLMVAIVVVFTVLLVVGVFALLEQFFGTKSAKKFLKDIKFPLSYNQLLVVAFVCIGVLFVLNLIYTKITGNTGIL